MDFKIESPYQPAGDQPQAIAKLTKGILDHKHDQILMGVTGSGKTFTLANNSDDNLNNNSENKTYQQNKNIDNIP